MTETVLITGGAGFIGSHLADYYLKAGFNVRVLDNLTPQVHGVLNQTQTPPSYLSKEVEFIFGDICDRNIVKRCLTGVDILSHHAAVVGVGQSMYEIEHYTRTNAYGTGVILDVIANEKHNVRKMIVASSMSIYGEGAYLKPSTGDIKSPKPRNLTQLKSRYWEIRDEDGEALEPIPTPESKPLMPSSIYAINKRDQEEMFLTIGHAYGIPAIALRYFNVYGLRQALSNPYTGVVAIFCSRLLNRQRPIVFEDGLQRRDFVSVKDVAQVNVLVAQNSGVDFQAINVGSGQQVDVITIARIVTECMDAHIGPMVTGQYRLGDIRHCFADITNATNLLKCRPSYNLESEMPHLIEWVQHQQASDLVGEMKALLERRKLLR